MPQLKYMAEKKVTAFGILDSQDLIQAAVIALMRARKKFDPTRGFKWITYALPRARGAMLDALRDADHVPRLERARLKARGEEGRKVLSIDHQLTDVSREGLPMLRDRAAERSDFWVGVRRRIGARMGEILERYFVDDLTLKEIGRRLGLSESRACQLLASAYRELRAAWSRQLLGGVAP
jgi:RNA polymerase sigma factor FliA